MILKYKNFIEGDFEAFDRLWGEMGIRICAEPRMRDMLGFYAHLLAKLVHFSHWARNSSHFLQSVCGEYQQACICWCMVCWFFSLQVNSWQNRAHSSTLSWQFQLAFQLRTCNIPLNCQRVSASLLPLCSPRTVTKLGSFVDETNSVSNCQQILSYILGP